MNNQIREIQYLQIPVIVNEEEKGAVYYVLGSKPSIPSITVKEKNGRKKEYLLHHWYKKWAKHSMSENLFPSWVEFGKWNGGSYWVNFVDEESSKLEENSEKEEKFSDENSPELGERVMAGLSFDEWTKERLLHEMDKNKNNDEMVNNYSFYLKLLDSEYWEPDIINKKGMEWLNQKPQGKFSPPPGSEVINASLLSICSELRIEIHKTMMKIVKKAEQLEKKGLKISYIGPKGVGCKPEEMLKTL